MFSQHGAIYKTRVRLLPAAVSGFSSAVVFFAIYYITLGLLPPTSIPIGDYHPISAWDERLDISQFIGTILHPPYATHLTWWIGASCLLILLTGGGIAFRFLCAWGLVRATMPLGMIFGTALMFGITSAISLGSGFNPAVMRQALPDVGFFFLGWTGWALLQMILCFLAYGCTLAADSSRGKMPHDTSAQR